ncbi:unnamed protein product [Nezara viridula]|uniref:Uncharacterized protein n=1 Tax=Nezara viridula TaxID=85310 RepID=A0A9P0H1F4_NEZVI|nr:unnamed protein product [Nezara viridula]
MPMPTILMRVVWRTSHHQNIFGWAYINEAETQQQRRLMRWRCLPTETNNAIPQAAVHKDTPVSGQALSSAHSHSCQSPYRPLSP